MIEKRKKKLMKKSSVLHIDRSPIIRSDVETSTISKLFRLKPSM